jgi:hypothetical protein
MRLVSLLCTALVLILLSAAPATARVRWHRAETPHFIIYGEVSERDMREAAQTLEQFDASLRTIWSLSNDPSPVKLEVYLLDSDDRLREVDPSTAEWVAGFYTPQPELIAAFATYDDRGLAGREILFHEYAHHFMSENLPGAYPAWFVEGFAEYLSTIKFERERIVLGDYSEGRAGDILATGQWPTAEQFLRHPDNMSEALQRRFYAQSWVAVHYLYREQNRLAQFAAYVGAIQNGADLVQAFEPAFGVSPEAFQEELQRYARGGIQRRAGPLPVIDVSGVAITSMSEAANDLLLPLARLRIGQVEGAEAQALAATIEARAAAYPDDVFAQHARLRAMILRGAYADARAAIEPMLAAAPTDGGLNFLMGKAYLEEARAGQPSSTLTTAARRHFVRAFQVNENDFPTLFNYMATYEFGDRMPDSAMDVAVRVNNLAPQVISLALPTAHMLMQRERWDEAAVILRRVAYAPHGGGSDMAQRMLQAAMRHDMAALSQQQLAPIAPTLCMEDEDCR